MGQLSGNSCNIITLLPLGLDCDSIDATTPDATNGIVALYITGGTSPYHVSWNNGSQGTLLKNLGPGEYTATVVDYYGDFTATTTCTVGFETFYLDEFENCENSNKIYYLANLPSIFTTGKTYELTTQTGCWVNNGITTYTGQTHFNSFVEISSGPYDICQDCLPEPTPPPVYPENLCLNYFKGDQILNEITLNSGGTINGYPSWTGNSPNIIVFYNTGTTRWEMQNWIGLGVPIFNSPTSPPIGLWDNLGEYSYFVNISSGICTSPPLIITATKTDPTCTMTNDGSIYINPIGGQSPYTYSIDGINYQISNVFVGLSSGNYTVYLKDNNNTVVTQSLTLVSQETFQNYSINLTPLTQTTNLVGVTETRTYTFKIEVTPTLPSSKTLNFMLPINTLLTGNTKTTPTITQTSQGKLVTFTTNGTATMSGPVLTSPTVTNTSIKPLPCLNTTINTSAFTENYLGSITGNGSITVTLTQQLKTPAIGLSNVCPLSCSITNVVSMVNQSLTPSNCSYLNSVVQPITYGFTKTGTLYT
jgi:hypothetical protein